MRYTIFVHNDNIHLVGKIFSFDPDIKDYKEVEYYQELCIDDLDYIEEGYTKFYITMKGCINGNDMEFFANKPEMTGEEKQEFREWCRLHKVEILEL